MTLTALELNSDDNGSGYMSVSVDGATPTDYTALRVGDNHYVQLSATFVVAATAGSRTVTAKYKTSGGNTATFANRSIIVIPLP